MANQHGKCRPPCPVNVLLVDGGSILLHWASESTRAMYASVPWLPSSLDQFRTASPTYTGRRSCSCSSHSPGSGAFAQYPAAVAVLLFIVVGPAASGLFYPVGQCNAVKQRRLLCLRVLRPADVAKRPRTQTLDN